MPLRARSLRLEAIFDPSGVCSEAFGESDLNCVAKQLRTLRNHGQPLRGEAELTAERDAASSLLYTAKDPYPFEDEDGVLAHCFDRGVA